MNRAINFVFNLKNALSIYAPEVVCGRLGVGNTEELVVSGVGAILPLPLDAHPDDGAGVRAAVGDRGRRRVAVVGVGVDLKVVSWLEFE